MCLICMKYRIIILIIINIRLGKMSLTYVAKTVDVRCIGAPTQSVMVGRTAFDAGETMAGR